MKNFSISILFLTCSLLANAQSANYQAQGYYYKAKELYIAKNYSAALPYIVKSKETLAGTNVLLQYLHIMCLVNSSDWVNANKELKTYFDIIEDKIQQAHFTKSVETLTEDETRALSKVMVDIQEHAAYEVSPEASESKRLQEIETLFSQLLYSDYSGSWEHSDKCGCDIKSFSEHFIILGDNMFKYETFEKEIDPRPSCPDYSTTKKVFTFNLNDIKSVSIVPSGEFSYCDGNSPGYTDPGLKIQFNKAVNRSDKMDYNMICWGLQNGKTSNSYNKDVYFIKVRLEINDPAKAERLNQLLLNK